MTKDGYTHNERHHLIADIIQRREASGEPLDSRSIIAEAHCSSRTLKRVRDALLSERAGSSPPGAHRKHILQGLLATSEKQRSALQTQVMDLEANLAAAQTTIAAQRESIERFEGLLSPIWREMATQVDALRNMAVKPAVVVAAPSADVRDITPLSIEVGRLKRQVEDLVQSNSRLSSRNAQLEEEISTLKCEGASVR